LQYYCSFSSSVKLADICCIVDIFTKDDDGLAQYQVCQKEVEHIEVLQYVGAHDIGMLQICSISMFNKKMSSKMAKIQVNSQSLFRRTL